MLTCKGYRSAGKDNVCASCDIGKYSETAGNNGDCTPCVLYATTQQRGSISRYSCTCMSGYYNRTKSVTSGNLITCVDWSQSIVTTSSSENLPSSITPDTKGECIQCPYCVNTNASTGAVVVSEGFWRNSETSPYVYRCQKSLACPGNGIRSCNPGYEGPLCETCSDGYSPVGTMCAECLPLGAAIFVFLIELTVFLILLYYLVRTAHNRKGHIGAVGKIMVTYIQTVAFIGAFRTRWPQIMHNFFGFLNLSSGPAYAFSTSRCIVKFDHLARVGANIFTVTGFCAPGLFIWITYRYDALKRFRLPTNLVVTYWTTVLVFLYFVHPYVAEDLLETVRPCIQVDNEYYLQVDMSISCNTSRYYAWRNVCYVLVVVWCVILPGCLFYYLQKVRKEAQEEATASVTTITTHGDGTQTAVTTHRKTIIVGRQWTKLKVFYFLWNGYAPRTW